MPSLSWSHFTITQKLASDSSFWSAVALMHASLPQLSKAGMMGYYNISYIDPTNTSAPLQFEGAFWMLDKTESDVDETINPVLQNVSQTYPVVIRNNTHTAPNYYDFLQAYYPAAPTAKYNAALGSRLLDAKALQAPIETVAKALKTAFPQLVLLGNFVSGPGVWNARPAGGIGSMTPAWRSAVAHLSTLSLPFHLLRF